MKKSLMTFLLNFLENVGFNQIEQNEITTLFQKKVLAKGDYFVREGQINQHLAFIEKGIFQYYFNRDGNELSTYIAFENEFIASLKSFLRQSPSKENIRAIAPAELYLLHRNNLNKLKNENEKFKNFYIEILEYQIVCIDDSRFEYIALTAEERYHKLLTQEPQLLQKIPLQYLASILGVTPRHLSRIRKNIR